MLLLQLHLSSCDTPQKAFLSFLILLTFLIYFLTKTDQVVPHYLRRHETNPQLKREKKNKVITTDAEYNDGS